MTVLKYKSSSALLIAILVAVAPVQALASLTFGANSITSDATLAVSGATDFANTLAVSSASVDANKSINIVRSEAAADTIYGVYSDIASSTANGAYGAYFKASGSTTSVPIGMFASANLTAGNSLGLSGADLQSTVGAGATSSNLALGSDSTLNILGTSSGVASANRAILYNEGTMSGGTSALYFARMFNFGDITTLTGLKVGDWINAGTVTTSYGIYIDTTIDVGTTKYAIYSSSTSDSYLQGDLGIGTNNPTAKLDISSDTIRLRTAKTPASAAAACNQGEIVWDTSFVYVCVATNTWKRSAIATW